jgi:hypothetical protein
MAKTLSFIYLTVFLCVVALASYSSPSSSALNLTENAEEKEISGQEFQEGLLPQVATNFFTKIMAHNVIFPSHIILKQQLVFVDVLKPPLA